MGLGAAGKAQLAALFPELDAATWERLQVSFPPGSAQDRFGNPAPQATIVPVDPQRLPAPLPPNLDPQLVISIQAEGATTFDVPAPITFPNLTGLSPGEQALIFSFNHDAGRWETLGSGTVSPDGQTIASDPGVGIRAPGWHFADRGSPAHPMAEEEPEAGEFTAAGVQDYLFVDDGGSVTLQFSNQTEETVTVEIGFDPQTASAFLEDLPEQSTISLAPGTQRTLDFFVKDLLDPAAVDAATENILYGAKFGVSASSSSGSLFDRDMFVYRLFDIADDDHTDGSIDFEKTFNDDRGGVLQAKPLKFALLDEARPSLSLASATANPGADPIHFGVTAGDSDSDPQIQFDPARQDAQVIIGEQTDALVITAPGASSSASGNGVGHLQLRGTAVGKQTVLFSKQDFTDAVAEFVDQSLDRSPSGFIIPSDFTNFFPADTNGNHQRSDEVGFQAKVDSLYQTIVAGVKQIFRGVDPTAADALEIVDAADGLGILIGIDNPLLNHDPTNDPNACSADIACAYWTDFGKADFQSLVAEAETTSLTQEQFRFDRITNRSFSDPELLDPVESNEDAEREIVFSAPRPFAVTMNLDQVLVNLPQFGLTEAAFANAFANTLAHEIGHVLGAIHLRTREEEAIAGGVMGFFDTSGNLLSFSDSLAPIVKFALGLPVALQEFTTVYDYYNSVIDLEDSFNDESISETLLPSSNTAVLVSNNNLAIRNENLTVNNNPSALSEDAASLPDSVLSRTPPPPFNASFLRLMDGPYDFDKPRPNQVRQIDLGATLADGSGGEESTFTLFLQNSGDQDLIIHKIELVNGTPGFSLEGLDTLPDALLPANPFNLTRGMIDQDPELRNRVQLEASRHAITVHFDPTVPGAVEEVLRIESNSLRGKPVEIPLSGLGVSPAGDITVNVRNNNAGGQDVHGGAKIVEGFATIGNIGSRPLSITAIRTGPLGANLFAAANLPADFGPANPLAIDPGESVELDLAFDAKLLGLQRGEIQIVSDDPDTPIVTQAIVGTGTLDQHPNLQWGDDYVAVQSRNAPFPQRTRSSLTGDFDFILPGETPYKLAVFDPESGLIWHSVGRSAPSGQRTNFNLPSFWASDNPDSDGDGLPDDIEFAIGTSPDNPDTDGDGIDDFTEIQQDLDPLSGLAVPTGIVASLPLAGEAKAVVVAGTSGDVRQHTDYVATGSHGLALVDVSQFDEPILLSQLDLAGDAVDVAVDERLQLAAVASDIGGLHRLDVSDRCCRACSIPCRCGLRRWKQWMALPMSPAVIPCGRLTWGRGNPCNSCPCQVQAPSPGWPAKAPGSMPLSAVRIPFQLSISQRRGQRASSVSCSLPMTILR